MAVKEKSVLIKNFLVGVGGILLILGGFFYFRDKKPSSLPPSSVEEVLIEEKGAVKKTGEKIESLTEEQIKEMKRTVDSVLSVGGESLLLKGERSLSAEAKRAYSDGKFYYRLTLTGLSLPEKGYYYEGWLVKNGDYLSVGRIEYETSGRGSLYYTASQNRLDYNRVVVTLEEEDDNPAPGKVILEGEF